MSVTVAALTVAFLAGRGVCCRAVGGCVTPCLAFRVSRAVPFTASLATAAAVASGDAAGSAVPAGTPETPATTGAPVSQAAPDDTGWSGTVELYGFLPWVNSTTTVRGFEADTTLNPSQILSKLEIEYQSAMPADTAGFDLA